ncbi:MAG: hypothetical protein WC967_13605 [Balneolaceae bacterium]
MKLTFTSVLFLMFLALKLTNNITWSWWWVFSPFWIPLSLAAFFWTLAYTLARRK